MGVAPSLSFATFPFVLLFLSFYKEAELAKCISTAKLATYNETVIFKKFSYERYLVNRSVPVSVKYEFDLPSSDSEMKSLSWEHNDEPIKMTDNTESEVHYVVEREPNKISVILNIILPSPRVSGKWKLTLTTTDSKSYPAVCDISAPPLFAIKLGAVRANEGEPLSISCDVEAYPPPSKIVWKRIVESDGRLVLVDVPEAKFKPKDSIENAVLEWDDATEFSGLYQCRSESTFGVDTMVFEVRIKTKLAYVWPCIGIILELIVLTITIIVYERMQSKRRKQEDVSFLISPSK